MKKTKRLLKNYFGIIFILSIVFVALTASAFRLPTNLLEPGGGGTGGGTGGGSTVTYPPTVSITATNSKNITSPTEVDSNYGTTVKISWSSSGAYSCHTFGTGINSYASNNAISLNTLSDDAGYTTTCSNSAGSTSASVKVVVLPVIIEFKPDSKKVNEGTSTNLNWNVLGAKSCVIRKDNPDTGPIVYTPSPSYGELNGHHYHSVTVTKPTNYYLSCSTNSTPPTLSSCHGTVNGSMGTDGVAPGPYEGQSCTQFKTQSTCLQGWPTHGCSWNGIASTIGYCQGSDRIIKQCSNYNTKYDCSRYGAAYGCVWYLFQ